MVALHAAGSGLINWRNPRPEAPRQRATGAAVANASIPARCVTQTQPQAPQSHTSQTLHATRPKVRLLEYDSDQEVLRSAAAWLHPDEVWDVAPCPLATERLVTVHSKGAAVAARRPPLAALKRRATPRPAPRRAPSLGRSARAPPGRACLLWWPARHCHARSRPCTTPGARSRQVRRHAVAGGAGQPSAAGAGCHGAHRRCAEVRGFLSHQRPPARAAGRAAPAWAAGVVAGRVAGGRPRRGQRTPALCHTLLNRPISAWPRLAAALPSLQLPRTGQVHGTCLNTW
jgi:hypothetical protein